MGFSPTWDPTAIVLGLLGAVSALAGIVIRLTWRDLRKAIVREVKEWVIDCVLEARKDIYDVRMANDKKLSADPSLGGAQLAMDYLRNRANPRGRDMRKKPE